MQNVCTNPQDGCEYKGSTLFFYVHFSGLFTDPLCQTSIYPNITFYDEPQEREFTSSGDHADFDNGVEVTVPPLTVPPGSTVRVKVQPGFASKDVFLMPEGILSASPSYLISSEGSAGLNREITVTMEHHVRVSTREEADDLLFLCAHSSPKRSGSQYLYEYQEVSEGRSEFTPGENKGRLTTSRQLSNEFIKIGISQRIKDQSAQSECTIFPTPHSNK